MPILAELPPVPCHLIVKTVEEEGIFIDNFQLVEAGKLREQALRELLASGDYPVRNPKQNIADLKAQIAANEKGVYELGRMVKQYGLVCCAILHAVCSKQC